MPSQKEQIKAYLLVHKKISPIEALNLFGCFRLAARIANLRAEGMKIRTEITRKGYAIYRLEGED